jgi:hypothetical protein
MLREPADPARGGGADGNAVLPPGDTARHFGTGSKAPSNSKARSRRRRIGLSPRARVSQWASVNLGPGGHFVKRFPALVLHAIRPRLGIAVFRLLIGDKRSCR